MKIPCRHDAGFRSQQTRQARTCRPPGNPGAGGMVPCGAPQVENKGFSLANVTVDENGISLGPVSYTHLDVYKRQADGRAKHEQCLLLRHAQALGGTPQSGPERPGGHRPACLLYTSK